MSTKNMASNKKQPIVSFKDNEEFIECAKEWQSKLFLDDWLIDFNLIENSKVGTTPEGNDELGICMYDSLNKQAVIHVANGAGTIAEFTLVHEILHCLTEYADADNIGEQYDSLELFYAKNIHSRLNQMAKTLLLSKYPNIDKDFFRIELDGFKRTMLAQEENQNPAMPPCCNCARTR